MPRYTHPARQLPSGAFIKQYLLSVFLELSPLPLTFVSMGSQDGPCASVPSVWPCRVCSEWLYSDIRSCDYIIPGHGGTSSKIVDQSTEGEGREP